jgi:CRP/FNR family transcriptional regulator, polysaccharide utilization system transcription regulator
MPNKPAFFAGGHFQNEKKPLLATPLSNTSIKTILLIEDNKEILENMIECLELEGYKILFANNGKEGVTIARESIPDLVICDVMMREMDGHEVLRLLLTTAKTFKIPFIFSTSNSENVDRSQALELGADDYIIKPFQLPVLLDMAKKWIKSGSSRHR